MLSFKKNIILQTTAIFLSRIAYNMLNLASINQVVDVKTCTHVTCTNNNYIVVQLFVSLKPFYYN